jgi:CheY-like chemotaxis protein
MTMERNTILIVEDDPVIAMLIRQRLEKMNYSVVETLATGEEAVGSVLEHQPDLILMDIMLASEMDGIAAAETIRKHTEIPIVFLTSFADNEVLEKAKTAHPAGYILKPFTDNDLRTTIEIALCNNT